MRRTAFSIVVLVTLGFAGILGLMVGAMAVGLGSVLPGPFAHMTHFTEEHHRLHDLSFGLLLGTAAAGMLTQLRAPARNAAGQLVALVPIVALALATALTNAQVLQLPWLLVGAATVLAAALHPSERSLLRELSGARADRSLVALAAVAAVPLLALAITNLGLQRMPVADDHATMGHYGFVAALSLTILGVALLASLRPAGWRPTAWVAGVLPVLFGSASLIFAGAGSSLDPIWAVAAIAWGVAFAARATLVARSSVDVDTLPATDPGATAGTSRAVLLGAIGVIALVVLFAAQHFSGGGGPSLHTPGTH